MHRAKSWDLNYPAVLLDGGYYADYASIMGTMGLSTMYHSPWDNLVSWVGPHVDHLANWSCEQVRADIEKRGDRSQWMAAGFDGFYLTRVIVLTMPPIPCMMCIQIELLGLHIIPSVVKILIGKVHHLVLIIQGHFDLNSVCLCMNAFLCALCVWACLYVACMHACMCAHAYTDIFYQTLTRSITISITITICTYYQTKIY